MSCLTNEAVELVSLLLVVATPKVPSPKLVTMVLDGETDAMVASWMLIVFNVNERGEKCVARRSAEAIDTAVRGMVSSLSCSPLTQSD